MGQLVQIHWTCGSLDEARKVSRFLVQERFVACANIIPWVESVYMWEGELHTDQETKVIFKTIEEKFSAVVKLPLLTISVTKLIFVVIAVFEPAPTPYAKSNALVTSVRTAELNFHKRSGAVHCSEVFDIELLEAVSTATIFLAI
mgnify:CR=1 FL=1